TGMYRNNRLSLRRGAIFGAGPSVPASELIGSSSGCQRPSHISLYQVAAVAGVASLLAYSTLADAGNATRPIAQIQSNAAADSNARNPVNDQRRPSVHISGAM